MTEQTTTPTTPATPEAERGAERPAKRVASTRKPRPRVVGVPNDPVADMLTRVRNAAGARHETVSVPTSRMKVEIAKILKQEGFISAFDRLAATRAQDEACRRQGPRCRIAHQQAGPTRVRAQDRDAARPRWARHVIVSTSSGVMTGREAEGRLVKCWLMSGSQKV
jgi:small subunit ribosomal protein S8